MDLTHLAEALFPTGYPTYPMYQRALRARRNRRNVPVRRQKMNLTHPPLLAADLFALAASMLMRSGAYHHVSPEIGGVSSGRTLSVSEAERSAWIEAGRAWRGEGLRRMPAHPKVLIDAWAQLWADPKALVYDPLPVTAPPPTWWKACLALMVIADEAALNFGFDLDAAKSAQATSVELVMRALIARGQQIKTLSAADADVACVLPKSRTPRVGCTLRSLSHHLALLPPRGVARACWVPPASSEQSFQDREHPAAFNLVAIPLPYRVRATAFSGSEAEQPNWGWFHVDPHWCPGSDVLSLGPAELVAFIEALLDRAALDVGVVHGVILPEMALSDVAFRTLADRLAQRPGMELLVSGVFDMLQPGRVRRVGNFAAMAQFPQGGGGAYMVSIREKHHRWRLDRSQIETYSLGAALDANRGWWEKIDILSRSLDIFTIRGEATVTTLICEDLARHDPCQELVRGIGPNLVFALLMDSAQLRDRWPGRYATVLADDPGSSVLTFTSLGLIERANDSRQFTPSRKIGLWRDDSGKTVEIDLPPDAQAMCLTLQPTRMTEHTLDGRSDQGGAQSWRLTGLSPVCLPGGDAKFDVILSGGWPEPAL